MTGTLTLNGIDALRLLSAFQVLRLPSGMYGVTHKRARQVISEMTGLTPIRGRKPQSDTEADSDSHLQGYLNWLSDNSR